MFYTKSGKKYSAAAENKGVSVAEYIKAAIKAKYEAETGEEIAL